MAALHEYSKVDLKFLAEEWEVDILPTDGTRSIIKKIEQSAEFKLEVALAQIKLIKEERLAQEIKEERLAQIESEKAQREFELERLRLSQSIETTSLNSSREERKYTPPLKSIIHKFDELNSDMALYLNLFERQASKLGLESSDYVNQLLALLPTKLAEQILRQPADKLEDFDYIKNYLLDRFKVDAESFRQKFNNHQRSSGTSFRDLVYDLETFLLGRLEKLEIGDFESLKKLLICDQIKKRASAEMKEKFLDSWAKETDPEELAIKLDEFESVRKAIKKNWVGKEKDDRKPDKNKFTFSKENKEKKPFNWRDRTKSQENKGKENAYEKKKEIRCFYCSVVGHYKTNCPKLIKDQSTAVVNQIGITDDLGSCFAPYLGEAEINDVKIVTLRDSGASFDLIGKQYIKPEQLTGESIWLKQPLQKELHCLPIASVTLKIADIGTVSTKAAVVDDSLEMNHYLLGNQTHEIIEGAKMKKPELINQVVTRAKKRQSEKEERERLRESETTNAVAEIREETPIVIPPSEKEKSLSLLGVNKERMKGLQREDATLNPCFEKANKGNSEFILENEILFRQSKTNRGEVRKQVIIPVTLRKDVMELCHSNVGGHLGVTKTKDKIFRYFAWPNSVKEIEEFVLSCHHCQMIGKPREVKKAPMKRVPIVTEVFTRFSADLTGPLPLSENENRYLLTAMCLSSKYPEAIPLKEITSPAVINGFLRMFSRFGFPREIQLDLGRSFTSELTETFFEKFGIKVIHSSIHHPQSQAIERFHRTVKRLLKVLCLENGADWEKNLPFALLVLRTTVHQSTGYSPAELVHGKNLRTPETIIFEKLCGIENEEQTPVTEYIFDLINRLKKCQELAIESMEDAREKRKLWYDRDAVDRKFKPGDQVLVVATYKPNKFAVSWIGPGTVEKQISETNYVVNIPGRREPSQVFHVNMLKPYRQRAEMINVLFSEITSVDNKETDLEIVYPHSDPNVYDFNEIVRNGNLEMKHTTDQIEKLKGVLDRHRDLFSNDPGRTDLIEHDIELISDKPVRIKPYRMSQRQTEILKREIKRMLELKIIEIGESDYSSPLILVEAPHKQPRPCLDYRVLNSITRTEYFPIPNIEDRLDLVSSAKFITLVDLTKGYWQIPLTPRAQRYAAFSTPWGNFRPLVMPFGLVNAPYRFSKFMSLLLQGCENFCVPYLDDIAIFSKTWEAHMEHLDIILKKLEDAKLKIKPSKCQFAQDSVTYLGHVVGNGRRSPAEAKIQAVLDFPIPKSKTEIRQILGMVGYYARYIENYATIVEPLTRALKGKNRKESIEWSAEMQKAFEEVKRKLTDQPILYAPNYEHPFIVQTDASDLGVGVILAQRIEKEEHPILYLSRKFTAPERNYTTTEKECAAIIFAIKKLKHYLDGQKFTIETDHDPLVWLKRNAGKNPRLMRWALTLQPYDYTVIHRPGREIAHVDCLSRM